LSGWFCNRVFQEIRRDSAEIRWVARSGSRGYSPRRSAGDSVLMPSVLMPSLLMPSLLMLSLLMLWACFGVDE
jgi:hypothetical protein